MPESSVKIRATYQTTIEQVSFSGQVYPLIEAKCVACHDDYDNYNGIKSAIAGIISMSEVQMMPPYPDEPLTDEEIEILKLWVEQGMQNN